MPSVENFGVSEFTVSAPADIGVMDYAIVDLNGDGYDDVIVTYFYFPMQDLALPMTILLGAADGSLTQAPSDFVTGGLPENVWGRQIVIADFNNDARPDFFVADHGFDASPFPGAQNTLVLSTPGGGFVNATANLPQLTDFSHSAAAGDFNDDGNVDLFVNNYNGGTEESSYLLLGDGTGGFTLSRALPADIVAGNYNSPATGIHDIDGDGDLDLILTPNFSNEQDVRILLNDGGGDFSQAETSFQIAPVGVQDGVVDLAIGDVTGDGLPDMVFSIAIDNYASGGQLAIFVNHGNGEFVDETAARVTDPTSANWILRNQLIDLNNDGHVDIVQVNSGGSNDGPILLNDGDGNFIRLPVNYASGFDAFTGAFEYDRPFAGDFNGDGRTDLATSRYSIGSTHYWAIHLATDPGLSQLGGEADDAIIGDESDESLVGEGGNDVIFAGGGDDDLDGGLGNDRLVAGDGDDHLAGGSGQDFLLGGAGADVLSGGGSADVLTGGAGIDTIDGGSGIDTADYSSAAAGVKVRLDRTSAQNTGGAGVDTLANVERITGSAFDDYLKGDSQANGLDGGAGNDVLDGGLDKDSMTGGAGDDFYYVDHAGDTVTELSGEGSDRVQAFIDYSLADNVENLTLKGAAAVTGTGNALANVIRGTVADNTLSGLGGIDELFGREGDDILSGGGSGDRLEGEAGRDTINGGGGDDQIVGGTQKDTLTGGAGADTFFFGDGEVGSGASSADVVTDFSQAEGDKIHVRQFDANTGAGGDQNFTFIGDAAFTGVAGQLHYVHAGPNTFVESDTDGDGTADFVIRLDGLHTLAAGDFVL